MSADFTDPMGYGANAQQLVRELVVALEVKDDETIQEAIDRLKGRATAAEAELAAIKAEKEADIREVGKVGQ